MGSRLGCAGRRDPGFDRTRRAPRACGSRRCRAPHDHLRLRNPWTPVRGCRVARCVAAACCDVRAAQTLQWLVVRRAAYVVLIAMGAAWAVTQVMGIYTES